MQENYPRSVTLVKDYFQPIRRGEARATPARGAQAGRAASLLLGGVLGLFLGDQLFDLPALRLVFRLGEQTAQTIQVHPMNEAFHRNLRS
jgi:hypothetical protein